MSMDEFRKVEKQKTSTEVRFGYLGHIRPWRGFQYGNITFANELDFDPAELDTLYDNFVKDS